MTFYKLHKEGRLIVILTTLLLILINLCIVLWRPDWHYPTVFISVVLYVLILQFFRNPERPIETTDDLVVYAPADGKVVVIEETFEPEYFKDRRIQVSIFMSPLNVHVNRNPVGGVVRYFKYHAGKYLVAWDPKSSTENERATIVIESGARQVLIRQIAGAMARRIVNYLREGEQVRQGEDMGFIKFGSRVDLFLPLDAHLEVQIGQKAVGNRTIIARL